MQPPQAADLHPGAVFYLTNAAGAPTTWVVYEGPAMHGQARVKLQNQWPQTVVHERLALIPGYQQINPLNFLLQGEEIPAPAAPPVPPGGYAAAGGRRRRTARRKSHRRSSGTRRSVHRRRH